MFSWMVGESCKSTCVGADQTTDTVKFVAADVTAEQPAHVQEQQEREQQERERQEQLRLQLERQRAEEAERLRLEKERQDKEARERAARERLEQEELERQRKIEQLRIEEERRKEEEKARIEAERREKERLEAQERARKEEAAARDQLQAWLDKNKYASVNTKKSKMMRARYPLHDAVAQKDATAVRLLLRFGADPALKNSSGRTAQELAQNSKGCEQVAAAFASQTRVRVGGA